MAGSYDDVGDNDWYGMQVNLLTLVGEKPTIRSAAGRAGVRYEARRIGELLGTASTHAASPEGPLVAYGTRATVPRVSIGVARRMFAGAATVGAVMVAGPLLAGAAGTRAPPRYASNTPQSEEQVVGGQLTSTAAVGAPAEGDLRSLTLERIRGGYRAHVGFGAPIQQLHQLNGVAASHEVFVTLHPPSGDRVQVLLRPDGRGEIQRVPGTGPPVTLGPAAVALQGSEVTLDIPASTGIRADWEIQAFVLVVDARNTGFFNQSPLVLVGALSGEGNPRVVPAGPLGSPIVNGAPVLYQRADVPLSMRVHSFKAERRNGHLIVFITLDAAPEPIRQFAGQPVAQQVIQVNLAPDPAHAESPYGIAWQVPTRTPIAFDATTQPDHPSTQQLDPATVTVTGTTLRYDLGPLPTTHTATQRADVSPVEAIATRSRSSSFSGFNFNLSTSAIKVTTQLENKAGQGVFDQGGAVYVSTDVLIGPLITATGTSGGFPWVIVAIAVAALVLVGGVVAWDPFDWWDWDRWWDPSDWWDQPKRATSPSDSGDPCKKERDALRRAEDRLWELVDNLPTDARDDLLRGVGEPTKQFKQLEEARMAVTAAREALDACEREHGLAVPPIAGDLGSDGH